jgi:hypothetical protein
MRRTERNAQRTVGSSALEPLKLFDQRADGRVPAASAMSMEESQYREDAQVLGEVGWSLSRAELPLVEVRLPRALGAKAVAAWEREGNEGPLDPDSYEQRVQRHRAGTLRLIGLSIVERGRWDGEQVVVPLGPGLIGAAVDAADDLPSRE